MADTFAPWLRRRPQAGRFQTSHRASGQSPRLSVGRLLRRPGAGGRPNPRSGVAKSPGGILDRRPGLPGKLSHSKLLISGYAHLLIPTKEIGDAPEGRIQEDEPERGGEAR